MSNTKIGIICASDEELAPLLPLIKQAQISKKAMLTCYEGLLENKSIVALYSGVGKVNAALATQLLIGTYQCDYIINIGTAGAIQKERHIFDTIVSMEVAYHDVKEDILTEFHPWLSSIYFKADEHLLSLANHIAKTYDFLYPIQFGKMVSGDSFIKETQKQRIQDTYEAMCVDMESASIAHVCYVNKVPFLIIRTLSDCADELAESLFKQNCTKASTLAIGFLQAMLKEWQV